MPPVQGRGDWLVARCEYRTVNVNVEIIYLSKYLNKINILNKLVFSQFPLFDSYFNIFEYCNAKIYLLTYEINV